MVQVDSQCAVDYLSKIQIITSPRDKLFTTGIYDLKPQVGNDNQVVPYSFA